MAREAREPTQGDKTGLLHSIVDVVFDLDEPLRQLGFALLSLHEQAARDEPETILLRSINLHTENFDALLPPDASVTRLMRRFQLCDPHVTCPPTQTNENIQTDAPLFEIVSSLELTASNPRITWWVRAGQWSGWGLSAFDRLLLCRFARTVIDEKEPKYHKLLALLLLSVARRVDDALPPGKAATDCTELPLEISVKSIRNDLFDLEGMLNFLPETTDLAHQTDVAISGFVAHGLFCYTDKSRAKVRVLQTGTQQNSQSMSTDE